MPVGTYRVQSLGFQKIVYWTLFSRSQPYLPTFKTGGAPTRAVSVINRAPIVARDTRALSLLASLAREPHRAPATARELVGSAAILARQLRAIRK